MQPVTARHGYFQGSTLKEHFKNTTKGTILAKEVLFSCTLKLYFLTGIDNLSVFLSKWQLLYWPLVPVAVCTLVDESGQW